MIEEKELNIEIVKLVKSGDENAFRVIFNSYYAILLAFSKEYVIDEEVGKNLVQEVFLKLWESKSSLNEETNIKSFLYRMTRNICLNYIKSEKVKLKYEERLLYTYNDLLLNYEALNQLDFNAITFKELSEIINNTIEQLPPQCRKIFKLSRYEELKNREIADKLNISVKAVEGHMSKALRELRIQLNKHYPSGFLSFLISIM